MSQSHKHNPGFLSLVNAAKKNIKQCSVEDVVEMRAANEDFVLVDCREESEWHADHIPDAIYLGRGVIERDIESKVSDPQKKIVLYCGGGFRSALAAENLQKMGYTQVLSMDGGIRLWKEKGLPVTKPK